MSKKSGIDFGFDIMGAVNQIIFNFSFKLLAVCGTHLQKLVLVKMYR